MSQDRQKQAESLFQQAADLPANDRPAFLDEHCAGDPDLRAEVEQLLTLADNGAGNFMSHGPGEELARQAEATMPTMDDGESFDPEPGDKVRYFGDYELLEEIDHGGMGVVYKARQISLNRIVALKMIIGGHLVGKKQVKRFRSEAESIANLEHPHIVPIYEMGDFKGCHYFSMKLIDGGNLAFHMGKFNQDPRAAADLMIQVARAVHHGHKHGILHRDLKPANILLDQNGNPFVSDFGLAKHLGADMSLTQPDSVLGTPSYMSPEQAGGKAKDLTATSDIYSLGAILYEMFCGRPPFKAESAIETIRLVREERPEALSSVNTEVDPKIESICMKCLSRDPQKRYGTAEALAQDLERWLAGKDVAARRYRERKNRVAVIRLAAAVIALAILLPWQLGWFDSRENVDPNTFGNNKVAPESKRTAEGKQVLFDSFDGKADLPWKILNEDPTHISFTRNPGKITIKTQRSYIEGINSNFKNIFLMPNPLSETDDFEVTTCLVGFSPFEAYQNAGIVCWQDSDNFVEAKFGSRNQGLRFDLRAEEYGEFDKDPGPKHRQSRIVEDYPELWMRVRRRGNSYSSYVSRNGYDYDLVSEVTWESGSPKYLGLFAKNSSKASEIDASFDSFEVRKLDRIPGAISSPPPTPEEWDKLAAELGETLAKLPPMNPWWEKRNPAEAQAVRSDELFNRVRRIRNDDLRLWIVRARLAARDERWKDVLECTEKMVQLYPTDYWTWYHHAISLAQVGDLDGYRRACAEADRRFAEVDELSASIPISNFLTLFPDAVDDYGPWETMIRRFVANYVVKENVKPHWRFLDAESMLGRIAYRRGDFTRAVELFEKRFATNQGKGNPSDHAFFAMALFRAGETERARQTLAKARQQQADRSRYEPSWGGECANSMLIRQAEALIDGDGDKSSGPASSRSLKCCDR